MISQGSCSIVFLLALKIIGLLAFFRGSKFYWLGCANVACSIALILFVDRLACACAVRVCVYDLGLFWMSESEGPCVLYVFWPASVCLFQGLCSMLIWVAVLFGRLCAKSRVEVLWVQNVLSHLGLLSGKLRGWCSIPVFYRVDFHCTPSSRAST